MHYGAYTYAIDGSIPTMVAKNGKKDMGSPNGFSRVSLGSSFSYQLSPIWPKLVEFMAECSAKIISIFWLFIMQLDVQKINTLYSCSG